MSCDCENSGWCTRHMVDKGERWHELCKTREDYYNIWEMGKGPGQENLTEEQKENIKKRIREEAPSIIKKAWNFTNALTKFVANSGKRVSKEEYRDRLEECDQCIFRDGEECLHKSCGCLLTLKAQWRTEVCPLGRWNNKNE